LLLKKKIIGNVFAKFYSNFKLKKYKKFMHVAPTVIRGAVGGAIGGYGGLGQR
jgi:hypothetical protein